MSEKYFPESEALSIKRLKVAIEKKDWDLLEKGINRIFELKKLGHKYANLGLWQELVIWSESEGVPPNLWERLNDFVESFSNNYEPEPVVTAPSLPAAEPVVEKPKSVAKDVVVVYNQHLDKDVLAAVGKYRAGLSNIIHNPAKHGADHKWLDDIARLVAHFDEQNNELKDFMQLLNLYAQNGTLITNSLSGVFHKMLVGSQIDVVYPGIKHEKTTDGRVWKFFPLGGTVNSFVCSACANRIVKTEFHTKTLVECCPSCKKPMYPDIVCIGENYSETLPQAWYGAHEKLVSAKVWVIINPPSHNHQVAMKNLLLSAAKTSQVAEVQLITHKPEVYELWRSKFAGLINNVRIREYQSSIAALLETRQDEHRAQNQY